MRQTVGVICDVDRWRRLISEYGQLRQMRGHTPQSRGQRFNSMIAELLQCWGIKARANVRAFGEIDVTFAIDGIRFVVEAKWEKTKADTGRIAKLQKRVRQRLSGTYGVFLSMSGYSAEALADVAHGDRLEVLLLDADHWEAMLGGLVPPKELLNLVHDHASFYGEPYTPLAQLFSAAEVPDVSFEPPGEMAGNPLLSAVDGVEAQVVLSGIDSGQLGVACYRQSGLLVTTERGILDVDPVARTVRMAVPVPDCRRNALVLEDQSIVFIRRYGVGRFHDGQITTIGGGFAGNCCLCCHPDGSVWVFDNGNESDVSSASVAKLEGKLGRQQRYEIDYEPASAHSAVWLSGDALVTIGNAGFLVSSPTTDTKSHHPAPQSNPMGAVTLSETAILTAGDNVSLRWTDTVTWTSRELARVAVRPSVTELALAANGDVYLAAYHDATARNLTFAVIRLRLPAELDLPTVEHSSAALTDSAPSAGEGLATEDLEQRRPRSLPDNSQAEPYAPTSQGRITPSPLDDAVRAVTVAQQREYERGYHDALDCAPSLTWHALEGLAANEFDIPKWLESWKNGWRDIELDAGPDGAHVARWLPILADYLGSLVDPIGRARWSFTPSAPYVVGFAGALREVWAGTKHDKPAIPADLTPEHSQTQPWANSGGTNAPTPDDGATNRVFRRILEAIWIVLLSVAALFAAMGFTVWLVTSIQGLYSGGTLVVAVVLEIASALMVYGCVKLIRKAIRRHRSASEARHRDEARAPTQPPGR